MKYRNDFVTNSSSSISLWKDFSVVLKSAEVLKLKYNKKITVYSGYPVDLKAEEKDLQTVLEDGEFMLLGLRTVYGQMNVPWVWEKFTLSDIFIEYLCEVNCGAKLWVEKSKKTGKLYLCAEFAEEFLGNHGKAQPVIFDMDEYTNTQWDALPDRDDGHHYYCNLKEKGKYPSGEHDDETYYFDERDIVRAKFLEGRYLRWDDEPKEFRKYKDTEFKYCEPKGYYKNFGHEYHEFMTRFARFLSAYTKELKENALPFSQWLATKYSKNSHFSSDCAILRAEGLCAHNGFMEEFYNFEGENFYDDFYNYEKIEKKV